MSIDFNQVFNGLLVMFFGAIGWILWQTSTTLAALKASFDAHVESDEAFQADVKAALTKRRRS